MLERAIELDPGYAKAHAKLALTYHRELWLNISPDAEGAAANMLGHTETAVHLDESDSFAHCMNALAHVWHGRMETALAETRRALALNPIDVDANFTAGVVLSFNGRPREGIPHMENALRISPHDPRSPMMCSQLAAANLDAGDFEHAVGWADRALGEGGASRNAHRSFANLLRVAALGHLDRAAEAQEIVPDLGPLTTHFDLMDGIFRLRKNAGTEDRIHKGLRKAGIEPD